MGRGCPSGPEEAPEAGEPGREHGEDSARSRRGLGLSQADGMLHHHGASKIHTQAATAHRSPGDTAQRPLWAQEAWPAPPAAHLQGARGLPQKPPMQRGTWCSSQPHRPGPSPSTAPWDAQKGAGRTRERQRREVGLVAGPGAPRLCLRLCAGSTEPGSLPSCPHALVPSLDSGGIPLLGRGDGGEEGQQTGRHEG